MPVPSKRSRSARLRPMSAALFVALVTAALTERTARAEIIPAAAMLHGVVISRQQCAATPDTLWVSSFGRPFCVRYYLSKAGGSGARPVVFLQGDKFGRLDPKTRSFYETAKFKDVDTDKLMGMAERLSKSAKTTAIYLARIGVDGTSGNHTARKTLLELNLMNAALDALKRRYRYDGFNLAGQSGGSLLIGGLIAMRDDIGCAVVGSGPLARNKPLKHPARRANDFFNPSDGIPQIATHHDLRVLVVTDHSDRQVPENRQTPFVRRLRQAGGHVDQFFGHGNGEQHHGVVSYTRLAMAGCVLGASNAAIAKRLAKISADSRRQRQPTAKEETPRSGKPVRRLRFRFAPNAGARPTEQAQ